MQDGQIINDGSVKWQICDTRIPFPVGYVVHDRILRPGFIKVNKAIILRNDFIRLYNWANSNGLIVNETLKNSDIKYSSCFGSGNGTTTFSLPDERGTVERGWDDGRGLDVNRELGTYQEDAIRNVTGEFRSIATYANTNHAALVGAFGIRMVSSHGYGSASNYDSWGTSNITFDSSNVVLTAAENRVRNIAKIAQIKY